MQTIIIILFSLALVSFSIQLQLLKNRWVLGTWLLIVAIGVYLMHHMAIEQSYKTFRATLTNSSLMMDFTVLLVLEALAGLFISIYLIRSHYNEPVKAIFKYAIYLPGITIFPALFYFESMVFLQIHGIDFELMAIVLSILAIALISLIKYGFKVLVPEFDLQLEIKFIVHLLQLVGGIFLSVVMLRLPVGQMPSSGVPISALLTMLLIVLTGAAVGMLWYRIKLKRTKQQLL